MSNLKYPNNYYKNRSRGIRFKLEKSFLNKLTYYVNEEIKPFLARFARLQAEHNNPDVFNVRMKELERNFAEKMEVLALKHFRDILKLSLTEKYGAWHRVPPRAVSDMLKVLWKQSKYGDKSKFFAKETFRKMRPLFKQSVKEWYDKGEAPVVESITELMDKEMSRVQKSVYTHSTYFVNSAYEIQFKQRDPGNYYRYIWGTRPDKRRTIQCEMIDQKVKKESKNKGVTLARLEEIVKEISNMPGFKKANPQIKWTPHYNCRSGIERVV